MRRHHFDYDITLDINSVIDRLEKQLHHFNHKTVLITGGTGFFGRWVLQIFGELVLNRKYDIEIYVLSRNPVNFIQMHRNFPFSKVIKFIKGDVISFKLPNFKLDYLIHMATTAANETYSGEDQLKKLELLYRGTINTLENAIANQVKNVLFTSSGVAYGYCPGVKNLSEDMLYAPITTSSSSALGEGKRLAEFLVAYYSEKSGYRYSVARCFSFYGPFLPLDIHYAFGNFVRDALNNPEIVVKGNGKELRSYLYIADAWVWLLKMLIKADNEIYNVGSSTAISIEELAKLVRDVLAPGKEVKFLGLKENVGNFSRGIYVPNNDKIKKNMAVSEWTSLNEGIKKMKFN